MTIDILHLNRDSNTIRWTADGEASALGEIVDWHAWRDPMDQRWTVEFPRPTGLPFDLLELFVEHLDLFRAVRQAIATFSQCDGLSAGACR